MSAISMNQMGPVAGAVAAGVVGAVSLVLTAHALARVTHIFAGAVGTKNDDLIKFWDDSKAKALARKDATTVADVTRMDGEIRVLRNKQEAEERFVTANKATAIVLATLSFLGIALATGSLFFIAYSLGKSVLYATAVTNLTPAIMLAVGGYLTGVVTSQIYVSKTAPAVS